MLFVPPEEWYHQHFNSGTEPTRYVRLGAPPGNEVYKVGAVGLTVGGNTRIQFREEDPYLRNLFEEELGKQERRSKCLLKWNSSDWRRRPVADS